MLDQYVTGNFPTLERLARNRLREQFPDGLSKCAHPHNLPSS
jgi:hypothetical protein